MSLFCNPQLSKNQNTSRIVWLSHRLTLTISYCSLISNHPFLIGDLILPNSWMLVGCLESGSTGEELSSFALTLGEAGHFPLYFVFGWSWVIVYIVHDAAVLCTHAVGGGFGFHFLLFWVIPAWRRIVIGLCLEISFGNRDLLGLGVLEGVVVGWGWGFLDPVVDFRPPGVADLVAGGLPIGS